MYITIIKALNIAISAISQLPDNEENRQAIIRLQNLKQRDCYIQWTKETVFEALDKWKAEHNRNPTVTNLTEPDMPKSVTIQKLFDMRASAFLNIYYPIDKPKRNTSKYTIKTKQEWIDDFITQFNSLQPRTSKEYNAQRDPNSPTWNTIARYLGIGTWYELLELTKVNTKCLDRQAPYNTHKTLTVNSTSSLYEKLETLFNS